MLLALLAAVLASSTSPQADPPDLRQNRNGEFMTRYYPPTALARGEEGKVDFELEIDRDGFMRSCQIVRGSGHSNLDAETCRFLIAYGKVSPLKDVDGRTKSGVINGFMNWRLPSKANKTLAVVGTARDFDPDKLICRRYGRPGSKVGAVKTCLTRAEWATKDEVFKGDVERMQDRRASCGAEPTKCD